MWARSLGRLAAASNRRSSGVSLSGRTDSGLARPVHGEASRAANLDSATAQPRRDFHGSSQSRAQDHAGQHSRAGSKSGPDGEGKSAPFAFFNSTGFETAMGASVGVLLLGCGSLVYMSWYKKRVIKKMIQAFDPDFDPVSYLAQQGAEVAKIHPADRTEYEVIRNIIGGREAGHYYLVLGAKGSGKTGMIIDAMGEIQADGCAYFDAHSDAAITVDRFSESINFAMNRDYLGNLLGLTDLSGMNSFQMLERSLHKLESALIQRKQKQGKPAVIIMNNAHLLRDEDGERLLTVFQQRAEKWASAGVATFVFVSQDYFIYDILRRNSNRMDTLTVKDLSRDQAIEVLRGCRKHYFPNQPPLSDDVLEEVYKVAGGRVNLLNKLARRADILKSTDQLVEDDMQWLLSKTGIIVDHDDDVMDEQKWATCSWLLFTELAQRHAAFEEAAVDLAKSKNVSIESIEEQEEEPVEEDTTDIVEASADPARDLIHKEGEDILPAVSLTWGEARQVMTRPDYILELDRLNMIHIDRHHRIYADNMALLRAMRRVTETEGFAEKLESVMDRVAAIESLGRTRELVWKEQVDGGKFMIRKDGKGREMEGWYLLGGDERLGREADEAQDDSS
ncbi:unnamed protein product [Tilletia laevis]|uniref:AAA protein C-terminal winged helix domain-containing protein n=3 Tax=Tilletia TaxID=13289 RepID=A0A8X7MVY1_9BASI|nr:hypothetical protein CF336_g3650 [Tilletia laevis]KAE8203100.1 hypothetical protein CF328_g1837 [Tilletia controversa]KAE8261736.1 hypothetical protein A4X03_0g3005 [Tilletia caries]KAE8203643.1 hypothetical protein CF335_g2943 [Tilletia laevis]KAE8252203.1 hypothetical protein A4X06_0g2352 [Tilletia controversa]